MSKRTTNRTLSGQVLADNRQSSFLRKVGICPLTLIRQTDRQTSGQTGSGAPLWFCPRWAIPLNGVNGEMPIVRSKERRQCFRCGAGINPGEHHYGPGRVSDPSRPRGRLLFVSRLVCK